MVATLNNGVIYYGFLTLGKVGTAVNYSGIFITFPGCKVAGSNTLSNYAIVLFTDVKSLIAQAQVVLQLKGSNHKQSARWQHVSRLKASSLCIW